jgi:hypothetical protein
MMSFATRLVPHFATLFAPLFVLLATPSWAPAQAADHQPSDYEVGASLVCDTQGQVERFVALFSGDTQSALRVVNAEAHDPSACAIVNVAFVRGTKIGMARRGDSAFEIVRILVVGIETENGINPLRPAVYFSAFGVTEYGV